MKTPEQIKAELQLEWMRTNLPYIPAETVSVRERRIKVLRRVLSNITVDAEGCFLYAFGEKGKRPLVEWPVRRGWDTGKKRPRSRGKVSKCQWPGGCERPPKPRGTRQQPIYCHENGHEPLKAQAYRRTVLKEVRVKDSQQKSVPRLILELYSPKTELPVHLSPRCGKPRCIRPSCQFNTFYSARLQQSAARMRRKYSREEVREMVSMRFEGRSNAEIRKKYPDVTNNYLASLIGGRYRNRDVRDLLTGKPRDIRRKWPKDTVRAIVQARVDDPAATYKILSARFGVGESSIRDIILGVTYADETEDLRARL